MYHSIVLVKQVPDTANVSGEAMKEDGTINRAALPAIFNPEDLYALEAALDVKQRYGGTVTAVSMGPPKATEVLRDCLYRGADRAVLITDRRAAASDTLATSYILSQAVKTIDAAGQHIDFVFAGRQAIDGDTAQTGPQCAEKLGIPQITYADKILEVADGTAAVRRNLGNGWETVKVKLPALLTVVETAVKPRPRAAKRLMKYKNAALEHWGLDEIGADLQRCGTAGSPTKVFKIQSVVLKKSGYTDIPPTKEGISSLVRELVADKTI
ncbi:MAG: electron transfer flavoprotein subunit beta/FixA family protein [Planctomycetaceae bacterium]|jgi:electron transfer flavoprotein beta subunit|nr:electron transfer flavoprotein subunit beta/FixA family protein [Planctomycetaceae bacterium]